MDHGISVGGEVNRNSFNPGVLTPRVVNIMLNQMVDSLTLLLKISESILIVN